MVWSAPAARASFAFSGDEMVVITLAPRAFANWIA